MQFLSFTGMEQIIAPKSPAETKPSAAGSFRKGGRNLWIWSFRQKSQAVAGNGMEQVSSDVVDRQGLEPRADRL